MGKLYLSATLITLLFAVSACSGLAENPAQPPTAAAHTSTPTESEPPPTATPINLSRQSAEDAKRGQGAPSECAAITQGDVAGLFAAETNQPLFGSGPVSMAAFSTDAISANESYCTFLAFHQPSSAKGSFYQVTYWVDTPDQATTDQWSQAWANAKRKAAHSIAGLGDDAFYTKGRLSLKKGSTYVTIEVLGNHVDTSTPEGVDQQIQIERQLAQKALARLG
jgi:hypothetical protein